jgi:hypothetical protein
MSAREIWEELNKDGWATLLRWVSERRSEGVHLDYKTGDFGPNGRDIRVEDQKSLAKGLSGFGNNEGGVLVFGAATTQVEKSDVLDGLPGVPRLAAFEERVVALSRHITTPPIPGLVTTRIPNPADPDRGVVAILVPQSDAGPFRAEGPGEVAGRYYVRSASNTSVMSHQHLASMFGARPQPRLRIGFTPIEEFKVQFLIENRGRGSAVLPLVRLQRRQGTGETIDLEPFLPWEDRKQQVHTGRHGEAWDAAAVLPIERRIYPGEIQLIGRFVVRGEHFGLRARIDADGGPPTFVAMQDVPLDRKHVTWLRSDWELS